MYIPLKPKTLWRLFVVDVSIDWATDIRQQTKLLDNDNNNNDNNDRIKRRSLRFVHSHNCAANCLQHVRSSGQGGIICKSRATCRALITCNMSCATWYEGTAQRLSLTEFISHLFHLYLIGWTFNWWRRGGNRSIRGKPLTMSLKKYHILKPDNSSPNRLEPALAVVAEAW